MELWIRSQDRMKLFRGIDFRGIVEQEGCSIIDNTDDYIIGTYKSIERALEVLDEIQDILDCGFKQKKFDSVGNEYYFEKVDKKVYEMPED